MRIKRIFFILVFLNLSLNGFGQKYRYAYYQGPDLPFKSVNQVAQDSLGYTWLATDAGLYRFDGNTFEDFNTNLRSRTIRAFAQTATNSLLFTNDTGIHRISYQKQKASTEVFLESPQMHYPTAIFEDSKGTLWVGLMNGNISSLDVTGRKEAFYDLGVNKKTPEVFFGEDSFGTVWVLVPGKGVFYYDEVQQEFRAFGNYEDAAHFMVEGEIIWLVGDDLRRIRLNGAREQSDLKIYNTEQQFQKITKKDKETLILSSQKGLYTFQMEGPQARLRKLFGSNDPHRVEDLPFKHINNIIVTRDPKAQEEHIWVSTDEGLGLLWSGFFQTVFGMGYDNILGLHTTANGRVYVSQGPVFEINKSSQDVSFKRANSLNNITGIATVGEASWFGSTDGKIFKYSDNTLNKTLDLTDRGGGIFFMLADHTGDVWFCQATSNKPIVGVAKVTQEGRVIEYGMDKGFIDRVLVVREGGKNELYAAGIGLSSYLYKYDWTQDRFTNKSLAFPFKVSATFEVHDMEVDDLGVVWLATTDGLLKYDGETVRRVFLGPHTDGEIRSIVKVSDSSLWMSTDTSGLIHLDDQGNYTLFDESSGTPSKVAAYRCLAVDSDSKIWVGTAEGVVYSGEHFSKPMTTKSPTLKSFVTPQKSEEIGDIIRLAEDEPIAIKLGTLTYPAEEIKYQYKIYDAKADADEVSDFSWIPLETSVLNLDNMAGGAYTMEVRAQKAGGFTWSKPLSVGMAVSKKWFKTWWGRLLLAAIGFLFFWFGLRQWFLRRIRNLQTALQQKQEELSQQKAEIVSQTRTLKNQRKELQTFGGGISLLHGLVNKIPENANWKVALDGLRPLVVDQTGIDAFELAFKVGEHIHFVGYRRGEEAETNRQEEFNEKENLASYALAISKPLMILDFEKEAHQYISGKNGNGYNSRLFTPFKQQNGSDAVFCIYSRDKNAFTEQELMLQQILSRFLAANAKDHLK